MRLRVIMDAKTATAVPINHQEYLTAVMYGLLGSSDAEYARFLHDEGYRLDGGPKKFKFFTFSGLRAGRRERRGETFLLGPGAVEWLISSPVPQFLQHCATGLLSSGIIRIGTAAFPISGVETLPAPDFTRGSLRGTCLSPIVAAVARPDGTMRYLRPADKDELSEAVRRNLVRKRRTLLGECPEDEPLRLAFNQAYLDRNRGGTKLMHFKDLQIVGTMAPFIATGSPALLEVGYECGFGQSNSIGFGMVEQERTPARAANQPGSTERRHESP